MVFLFARMQYTTELHYKTPCTTRQTYTNLHRLVKTNILVIVHAINEDNNEGYISMNLTPNKNR